ncbi:serine/threonine protein kinase [Actinomadura rudentiformis]|uniref:serine/threonine protein kinase n=1 Tax=Actinomadura rudentiformis TaxID=359158 RepID=UPI001CEFAA96|nr:serine/threonine protein kinase [Actinomadura rudentiformis]
MAVPLPLNPADPVRLGPYEVTGRLGTGGQGVVFLGRDENGHRVAIKLLHADLLGDRQARARFVRELSLLQRVAGFCTAKMIDADVAGDQPYIVSEFVPGPSLRELVLTEGPRAGADLDRLAISSVTALAAIHRAGIVHRDFKPQNVLMGPDGPRVIDFGIARALDAGSTVTSQVVGTPVYMAPEQFLGAQIGPAADLHAWAATLLFAATGTDPFAGGPLPTVMYRILYETPDLSVLPSQIAEVAAACLTKDPQARPSSQEILLWLLGDHETPVTQGRPGTPTQPAAHEPPTTYDQPRAPGAYGQPAGAGPLGASGRLAAYDQPGAEDEPGGIRQPGVHGAPGESDQPAAYNGPGAPGGLGGPGTSGPTGAGVREQTGLFGQPGGYDRPGGESPPGAGVREQTGLFDQPDGYDRPGGHDRPGGAGPPGAPDWPGAYEPGRVDRSGTHGQPGVYGAPGETDQPAAYEGPRGPGPPGVHGQPGGSGTSGVSDWPGAYGQPGGVVGQPGTYEQPGTFEQPGTYEQPGAHNQHGEAGWSGSYTQPGAYDPHGAAGHAGAYGQAGPHGSPDVYDWPGAGAGDHLAAHGTREASVYPVLRRSPAVVLGLLLAALLAAFDIVVLANLVAQPGLSAGPRGDLLPSAASYAVLAMGTLVAVAVAWRGSRAAAWTVLVLRLLRVAAWMAWSYVVAVHPAFIVYALVSVVAALLLAVGLFSRAR